MTSHNVVLGEIHTSHTGHCFDVMTEKKKKSQLKSTKKMVLITNRAKAHIGSSDTEEAYLLENKTKNLASLTFPPLFLPPGLLLKMWSEGQAFLFGQTL